MADPRDLAAAYALGALDAKQREEYEAWLATEASPADIADADGFSETAAALGLATEPVPPSAAMRRDILSMIDQTPQLSAVPTDAAEAVVPEAPDAAAPISAAPVAGFAEQRAAARWFRRPGLVVAAAAAAVALFVGGGGVVGSLVTRDDFAVTQATALAELQAAPDSQSARADVAGGGTATLVWSAELARSAVAIDGLPALPQGRTYQLWYVGADGAIADATFEAGQGTTWRVLDGDMSAGDAVAVTVEPEGGSKQPSTDPIVVLASA